MARPDKDVWLPEELRSAGERTAGPEPNEVERWTKDVANESSGAPPAPEESEWMVLPGAPPQPEGATTRTQPEQPADDEPARQRAAGPSPPPPPASPGPDPGAAARAAIAEAAQAIEAQAERRIDAAEARAREAEERAQAALEHAKSLANELAEARRTAAASGDERRDDAGRVELNAASFESLREIGLTVTQAARVVGLREARGGLGSMDELDEVPGLPKRQRALLRERAYVEAEASGSS